MKREKTMTIKVDQFDFTEAEENLDNEQGWEALVTNCQVIVLLIRGFVPPIRNEETEAISSVELDWPVTQIVVQLCWLHIKPERKYI